MFATVEWSALFGQLGPQLLAILETVLPAIGAIVGVAFAVRWAVRRFGYNMDRWERDHAGEIREYERGERDSIG